MKTTCNNNCFEVVIQDGIEYSIDEEEMTAKVIGCQSPKRKIIIPRSIKFNSNEYIVTSISKEAFKNSKNAKSVRFTPDSELYTIEKDAFLNSSVESITIPTKFFEYKDKNKNIQLLQKIAADSNSVPSKGENQVEKFKPKNKNRKKWNKIIINYSNPYIFDCKQPDTLSLPNYKIILTEEFKPSFKYDGVSKTSGLIIPFTVNENKDNESFSVFIFGQYLYELLPKMKKYIDENRQYKIDFSKSMFHKIKKFFGNSKPIKMNLFDDIFSKDYLKSIDFQFNESIEPNHHKNKCMLEKDETLNISNEKIIYNSRPINENDISNNESDDLIAFNENNNINNEGNSSNTANEDDISNNEIDNLNKNDSNLNINNNVKCAICHKMFPNNQSIIRIMRGMYICKEDYVVYQKNKTLPQEVIDEYCDKILDETFNPFFPDETNNKYQPEEIFLTDEMIANSYYLNENYQYFIPTFTIHINESPEKLDFGQIIQALSPKMKIISIKRGSTLLKIAFIASSLYEVEEEFKEVLEKLKSAIGKYIISNFNEIRINFPNDDDVKKFFDVNSHNIIQNVDILDKINFNDVKNKVIEKFNNLPQHEQYIDFIFQRKHSSI